MLPPAKHSCTGLSRRRCVRGEVVWLGGGRSGTAGACAPGPCVGTGIGGENRRGLGDREMKTES